MLHFVLLLVLAGSLSAVLVTFLALVLVRRLVGRARDLPSLDEPLDPFVAAQLDRAAAQWAERCGRPEAAPLMADKLRLLHRLAERRSQQ